MSAISKNWFLLCWLAIVGSCDSQKTEVAASSRSERPRLVVLCSVDQLATWVFEQGMPHFAEDGGFRRLMRQGVRFPNCAFEHASTETGPGHATIGTGAPSAVHGIVRNTWWSRDESRAVYCVSDPAEPLPGLEEGRDRTAGRLLAETLSARVRAEFPDARIASLAFKDRAAILMIGAQADVAAWLDVSTGKLVTNKAWCAEVPAWIERFNRERPIDSFYGLEWKKIGSEAAYEGLVDDRPYEVPHRNGSGQRTLPQLLTGGLPAPGPGYWTQVYHSPFGNELVRRAAQACIDGMELGRDAVPDLLAVSFSSTDPVGHYFGPDSVEARDALLRLDRQLGDFLTFLDRRVGEGRYAIFLTADHGVGQTPEWAKANGLDAGRGLILSQARALAEQAIKGHFGPPANGRRYCAHAGGWALVLDAAALAREDGEEQGGERLAEASRLAAAAAARVRGVQAAYTTQQILSGEQGVDPVRDALRASLHPDRSADVHIIGRPNWLSTTTPASHGTAHPYDRRVAGLAMGPGVARGVVNHADVTPGLGVVLLAELLGIAPPAAAVDAVPEGVLSPR